MEAINFISSQKPNMGDFLVDDRTKNGAGLFRGEHIHVGQDPFLDWETVVNYLLPLAKLK